MTVRVMFAGGGTGGHLYPGLAIARALVKLAPNVEPFFVGALRGIERDVLPKTEFDHLLLDLHPIYRQQPWRSWRTVRGFESAWRALARENRAHPPATVIGTGGYASGAALAFARTHGIQIQLQEQNSVPGITTRFFARRAAAVYLGYPEARAQLRPGAHTQLFDSGNPIEPPPVPLPSREQARVEWGFPAKGGQVLLAFGGSQGARPLNDAIASMLEAGLPSGRFLIWATGKGWYDAYAKYESPSVRVRPYLAPIQGAYAAADLALTRAGALTVAELCAWGIPSILVPLPTAAADHQRANARALQAAGAALMLEQSTLTATVLGDALTRLLSAPKQLSSMAELANSRGRPDAAERIATWVLTIAQLKSVDT
ncbi:MAG: UDP-N-acetylglucosamine--N-acetylmuramyl-(pentapeptide) pyrophosphoryl-undecaprenol N-acetylglucosamine transferase [Gemmatimonadaceae bacterium]|nr:UDP-N-acetylglucosamine--N-acetylmuramyl-(pentapeptide) pyrophosphoryl-undecaprenol N-acetylglucosamine transferase [Gemmatimonadaceae bacterium]